MSLVTASILYILTNFIFPFPFNLPVQGIILIIMLLTR